MKKKLIFALLLVSIFNIKAQTSVLKTADSILQTGNYQAALIELQKERKPSFEVLEKMARIYQKVGNHSKAIHYFNSAYALHSSDKIKEQLGKSYQLLGNSDKAIEIYTQVLQTNPDNLLLKYTLAKLYMSERKVNKSIELLKALSKKDSLNPNYQYQLGVAYQKLGQKGVFDSANSFLKAYKIDSLHLKSIYNLAKFYRKLKFKDSATIFINRGLKINPKSINFNQLKVKDAFYKKEFDTTLVYLKRLEDLHFKTKFVYKLYGLTYLNIRDFTAAETSFKKALRIDFTDASILYNLGLVYTALQDYKTAEYHFLLSILQQKPTIDKNYYQLGMVQLKQKKTKRALKSFEKGYKNNSKNYLLLFQLALTSDDFYKDKKIALQHFEKYIDTFSEKDAASTIYAKQRIKEIKTTLFMNREKVD